MEERKIFQMVKTFQTHMNGVPPKRKGKTEEEAVFRKDKSSFTSAFRWKDRDEARLGSWEIWGARSLQLIQGKL